MDNKIFVCVLILISCMGLQVIDATTCKPLSKFKIDCNTCFCSRDGARYACTRKPCRGEPSEFQFINDEGYDDEPKNDRDYRIPYINDEIPQSKEDWEDGQNEEVNPDDYLLPLRSDVEDPRFDKPIQDVDMEDQEVEDMNNDFRFKREIFV